MKAGFVITGTWPIRTERTAGLKTHMNSLASSIVLVLRKRPPDAPTTTRREFIQELYKALPKALDEITRGNSMGSALAPVDVSQAIIGPGMAVFSKYSAVVEPNGSHMRVKTVLQLINRFLTQDDFDHGTQFCLHWLEQHGFDDGPFGEADVLARATQTSVGILTAADVLKSGGAKVRLLRHSELSTEWDPKNRTHASVWELLHRMIGAYRRDTGGERAAGRILADARSQSDDIRQLGYRLYTLCDNRGMASDARVYDDFVRALVYIEKTLSSGSESPSQPPAQLDLTER